jgi:hypothetical protein
MLSGALVGLLRVGAVGLAAGGLGAGVYFVAQSGGDEDNGERAVEAVTATSTLEAPASLTPPTATATVTATVVLAPTPTASSIDTSGWQTYQSPLGFVLKYPPGWLVEVNENITEIHPGFVKILNPMRQATVARQRSLGQMEGGESGDAWIEVSPGVLPQTVEERLAKCGPQDEATPPTDHVFWVRRETVGELPAGVCGGSGLDSYDPLQKQMFFGEGYFLVLPQDQPLDLIGYALDPAGETLDTMRAIILSLELTP